MDQNKLPGGSRALSRSRGLPWTPFESAWERFGGSLGILWALSGGPWGSRGALGGPVGVVRGTRGSLWEPPGGPLGAFGEQNEGHRAPLESLKNHWFYWCFCYVRVPGGSLEATLGLAGVPCDAPNGPCALFGVLWCPLGCSGGACGTLGVARARPRGAKGVSGSRKRGNMNLS